MIGVVESRADTRPEVSNLGPEASFEQFFRAHHRRLFQAVYLLTGSSLEADDVAQEALLRVFERWKRVSTMDRPDGYLYRTALNLHRSRLRRAVRWRRRIQVQAAQEDATAVVETRLDVQRALRSLTREQREAVLLVDWAGLSAEEAGRVLGIEPVSVRSRLHRGRKALRKALGGGE